MQRTTQPRISESNRWSKVFQEDVVTPLRQGSSECIPLEILSVQSSRNRKFSNSQVDQQVFTVFAALERRMGGPLAMSEEQRQGQYLADVGQENNKR